MQLTIHRGTKEIGGTCIELQSENSRILLDFGMPLVDDNGDPFNDRNIIKQSKAKLIEQGILPNIKGLYEDEQPAIDAILLSHPHQDHYGLMSYINSDIPIYMSRGCKMMIGVSAFFEQTSYVPDNAITVEPWETFYVGDFAITPYLADHSGFDAFSYLIEGNGKKIFFTGDLRAHGRKGKVFNRLIKDPPKGIDYLLLEGTMIGRGKSKFKTENDVEKALIEQFKESGNLFFIACSSQNIDRLVSVYRACVQSGRTFVIDPYTAYILEKLRKISPNIPQFNWGKNIGVHYVSSSHSDKLFETKEAYKYKSAKITFGDIVGNRDKFIVKDSFGMRNKFASNNALHNSTLIFSMWDGYLLEQQPFWDKHNIPIVKIHCSGHAYVPDLAKLAKAINPKHIIPVHTFYPEKFTEIFDNVLLPTDSRPIEL